MSASQKRDGANGSITIFLCLTLTCIMALIGGLYESARAAGCGFYMQMALDSALDSAAACYFRPLWDRYRIFGFWCDGEAGLEETLEPYLRDYMAETPYYRLADSRVEATQILSLTDREGEFYEQEAVEYMKLGVFEGMPEAADAAEAGNLLHQAGSLGKVLGSYRTNGRDVLRLEKAAENIRENMEKQAEAMRKADDALREGDGGDFSRYTGELQDRCRKMPALVKKYEAEADRLAKQLNRSREEAAPEQENMSGGQWALAEQEMADFQSYVDRNGERRKQIVQAGTDTEDNIRISERAEERAEEVQEIIDSWDDDEDDEHDEEDEIQLWRTVLNITDGYHREDKVSTVRGEQNKKTMHLLEDLGNMGTEAIFTLCIPDGMTVSGRATAQEDFPSVTAGVSGGLQFPGQGKNPVAAILDPVLFAEYGIRYFPSAVDTASSAGLHYETEYLLAGKAEDRECLKEITNRLVLARTALNMLSILQDAEKKAEAEALAALIAGTTVVLAPLVSVLYYLILTVWAMMEAIADVRCLLSGGKVPLMKGPEDWTISLSGLVEQGKDAVSAGTEGTGHGMAYRDWMRLALLLTDKKTLRYRMMDMCQENLREQNGDFRMGECLFRMEAEFSGKGVLIPLRRRSVKEY